MIRSRAASEANAVAGPFAVPFPIASRLVDILACPRCRSDLRSADGQLHCALGHRFPVVEGIPVFLLPEHEQTIGIAAASYRAGFCATGGPLYLDTLAIDEAERGEVERAGREGGRGGTVDPAIAYLLGATCGAGYRGLIGKAADYPIPLIPLCPRPGELLLDLGCSWGRWSISALRQGWRVVGIDPSLGALMAARRAFGMQAELLLVCGDARFLPFNDDTFAAVFSYSVLQHFAEADADGALAEIGRVLQPGGIAKIQMAHRGGLRARYIRRRPYYAESGHFRVRYWSLPQMLKRFTDRIGPSTLSAEAFGGLGLLAEDFSFVSIRARVLILMSMLLKNLARPVKPLLHLADSVYVVSIKRRTP